MIRYAPVAEVELREHLRRAEALAAEAERTADELRASNQSLLASVRAAEQRSDLLLERVRRAEERLNGVVLAEPEVIVGALRQFLVEDADQVIDALRSLVKTALR